MGAYKIKRGFFRWGEKMIVLNGFLTLCHLTNTRGEVGDMCIVVVVEEVLVGFSLAHQYEVSLCAGSSEALLQWVGVFCWRVGWRGVGVVASTGRL